MIQHITLDELKHMTETKGLILQGLSGDLTKVVDSVNAIFKDEGILLGGDTIKETYYFERDGQTNLLLIMDGLNIDTLKLTMWRLESFMVLGSYLLSEYLSKELGVTIAEKVEDTAPPIAAFGERLKQTNNSQQVKRHFDAQASGLIKLENVDVPLLVMKMHTLIGEPEAAEYSLQTIAEGGSDFYLRLEGKTATIHSAKDVYNIFSDAYHLWTDGAMSGVRTFALVFDRRDTSDIGGLYEIDPSQANHRKVRHAVRYNRRCSE